MNNLIFLDTETTGNEILKDHLFQVSYMFQDKIFTEYFKPPIPISIKAQSITHVTNKMIEDKGIFAGSKMQSELKDLLKENILVAHNAQFDIAMLSKEGIDVPKFICTLKVARFLDENLEIPEYNLQYLRYYFGLEVDANSHEAKDDVLVLKAVFDCLYQKMLEKLKDEVKVITTMLEVSVKPFLFKVFPFGKYKGRNIEEIAKLDKGYLEWLLNQKMQNTPESEEDWIFSLKHYLKI